MTVVESVNPLRNWSKPMSKNPWSIDRINELFGFSRWGNNEKSHITADELIKNIYQDATFTERCVLTDSERITSIIGRIESYWREQPDGE